MIKTAKKTKKLKKAVETKDTEYKGPNKLYAVYGTLRQGFGNSRRLMDSKLLGTFRTEPIYTMLNINGGFPGLVLQGNTAITMEVYEVKPEVEPGIDMLEGYSPAPERQERNLYNKIEIPTPYGKAYTYIWNSNNISRYTTVDTGDWSKRYL